VVASSLHEPSRARCAAGAFGLGWYRPARAQQTMSVIGFLHSGAPGPNANRLTGFRKGLREGGFVEGQNVAIEFRWAEDRNDRLPELAADLVRRRVNVITALSATQAALAAKAATQTIPIVFQVGTDPVAIGLVASLNRPGGNAIGISSLAAEIDPPQTDRVVARVATFHRQHFVLANPTNPNAKTMAGELQSISHQLNLQGQVLHVGNDEELRAAFGQISQKPNSGVVVGNDPAFFIRRTLLAELAASRRVPTIAYERDFAFDGGLMSYGPRSSHAWELAGGYVAQILNGKKPADLPVTQVAAFEFVLNLKAAKGLGLVVPANVLALADEVID
jgi:putative tryptophan/tyrosine transport system substrate-binding protein